LSLAFKAHDDVAVFSDILSSKDQYEISQIIHEYIPQLVKDASRILSSTDRVDIRERIIDKCSHHIGVFTTQISRINDVVLANTELKFDEWGTLLKDKYNHGNSLTISKR
jgi:hypothetical protein